MPNRPDDAAKADSVACMSGSPRMTQSNVSLKQALEGVVVLWASARRDPASARGPVG